MKERERLTHKVCASCKEVKSVSEFYRSKRDYLESRCKPCSSLRVMEWRRNHPEQQAIIQAKYRGNSRVYFGYRLKKWGITLDVYDALLEKQGHACPICKKSLMGQKQCIDHDHSCECGYSCTTKIGRCCGKCIRGILCNDCNIMLGMSHDNVDILSSAMAYLYSGRRT